MEINYPDQFNQLLKRFDKLEAQLQQAKPIMSLEQASIFLGMSKSYIYKLTSAGILPHSKPNGKTLFFSRDLLIIWALSNPHRGAEELDSQAATYNGTKDTKLRKMVQRPSR